MSKPVEQADVGDELYRTTWLGFIKDVIKVIDIDKDRRYALACDEKNDTLYIVNLTRNSANDRAGTRLEAYCSCTTYLAAPPEERHNLAWGF